MASSANSSTKNPPIKRPRTDVIDISSNESSPIQNNFINTTLDTTLALTILSPITSQAIPTQGIDASPLAPRALAFSTPPSSPFELHPYSTTLEDLPPRISNPPPPSSSQDFSQTLPQQTPMEFKPSFPPINLSRSRMSAQPEPFMSRDQVLEELSQLHTFFHNIEEAIQNAQNVQNSLIPPTSITSLQMLPPFHFTTTSTTTIPPFRPSLPPSSTFVRLDQSLWMEGPSLPQPQEHSCPYYQCTKTLIYNLRNEMRNLPVNGDASLAKVLHGVFQIALWILWNWRN
ncbi:hypothetical protein Tco_0144454 [Tanacetum coccineum]